MHRATLLHVLQYAVPDARVTPAERPDYVGSGLQVRPAVAEPPHARLLLAAALRLLLERPLCQCSPHLCPPVLSRQLDLTWEDIPRVQGKHLLRSWLVEVELASGPRGQLARGSPVAIFFVQTPSRRHRLLCDQEKEQVAGMSEALKQVLKDLFMIIISLCFL